MRNKILALHKTAEQTIDIISKDEVTTAGFSAEAWEKAKGMIESFEKFIQDNKDEITAVQILCGFGEGLWINSGLTTM